MYHACLSEVSWEHRFSLAPQDIVANALRSDGTDRNRKRLMFQWHPDRNPESRQQYRWHVIQEVPERSACHRRGIDALAHVFCENVLTAPVAIGLLCKPTDRLYCTDGDASTVLYGGVLGSDAIARQEHGGNRCPGNLAFRSTETVLE